MSPQDESIPVEREIQHSSSTKWLLLSIAIIAMLAFAAAHVSGRAAIVCRFAPMFGFVAGAAIGIISGQGRGAAYRRRLMCLTVLTAAGFVGLTLESHRLYAAELQKLVDASAGLNLLPPEMIDKMQQDRAEVIAIRSRFSVYLRYRISDNRVIGDNALTAPWPTIIWSIEIILAAVLAAITFHLFARQPLSPRERDNFEAEGDKAG